MAFKSFEFTLSHHAQELKALPKIIPMYTPSRQPHKGQTSNQRRREEKYTPCTAFKRESKALKVLNTR